MAKQKRRKSLRGQFGWEKSDRIQNSLIRLKLSMLKVIRRKSIFNNHPIRIGFNFGNERLIKQNLTVWEKNETLRNSSLEY